MNSTMENNWFLSSSGTTLCIVHPLKTEVLLLRLIKLKAHLIAVEHLFMQLIGHPCYHFIYPSLVGLYLSVSCWSIL